MRNPTPRGIAFICASVLAILVFVFGYIPNRELDTSIFLSVFTFTASFILVFYLVEVFIYRKIKLIYKTIYRLKTEQKSPDITRKEVWQHDPMEEVNMEVINWAKSQKDEIEQLKRLELFRKEFLGNVSHELKTPIFNLQGYIHTLLDGAIDDPEVNKKFLKKAAKSIDRLTDLVEDLIHISQLETGQLRMEMEKFDIHNLTLEIFEALEMRANEKQVTLTFKEGCDKPFWVYADRGRIRQVLVNLIVNSIKYGRQGGKVLVSFYDMDELILVEVADDGEGIEEHHLNRLFERFYRVDKSRSRDEGGSGLGLAIVKHIIEAHNQTINVRSKVGKGTTFGFTLKRTKPE